MGEWVLGSGITSEEPRQQGLAGDLAVAGAGQEFRLDMLEV